MAKRTAQKSTKRPPKDSTVAARPKAAQRKVSKQRRLQAPVYKSFHLSRRIAHPKTKVMGGGRIFRTSLRLLFANWRLFGLLALANLALTFFLVRGFGSHAQLPYVKSVYQELTGSSGGLRTGLNLVGALVGSGNNPSGEVGGAYQAMLLVVMSLAAIWALRQLTCGAAIRLRDAFYKGMYPLVPFLLVLLVVAIQLIPMYAAVSLYVLIIGTGIAATLVEQVLWLCLIALLALWSLYMLVASLFALYIVTLPDMTPLAALRSARRLVLYRRWMVMRRVLFLPFILLFLALVLLLPLVLWLTPVAEWAFVGFSAVMPLVVHSYMYSLYRELIA